MTIWQVELAWRENPIEIALSSKEKLDLKPLALRTICDSNIRGNQTIKGLEKHIHELPDVNVLLPLLKNTMLSCDLHFLM